MNEKLRHAIAQSGKTHYRLGRDSGINSTVIDRFMAGRDINLATAAKLAAAMDMELQYELTGKPV